MLGDALQPLSWKHAQLVHVTDQQLLIQQGQQHAAHSLLQLAPVHLLLQSEYMAPSWLQLSCIRHLWRLEQHRDQREDISPLLQQPAALQLRQLQMNRNRQFKFHRVVTLSCLTALNIYCWYKSEPSDLAQMLEALTQLLAQPQLTELALRGSTGAALVQPLLRSAGHLRRLHLNCHFILNYSSISAELQVFSSLGAALPQLEVLSLANVHIQAVHLRFCV
jgi:hypothetical protein